MDGLNDGEEVNQGMDGWKTNTLSRDCDVYDKEDLNPKKNFAVTVHISEIKDLDDWWQSKNPVGENSDHHENLKVYHTANVPDDETEVKIKIQAYDAEDGGMVAFI